MVRLLQVLLRFYHHESCGQCTPCREGMGWMHRIIDRIVDGKGVPEDIERLYAISHANDGTTICGMGDAAGFATVGILNKYRDEFEYFIANKRSKMRREARMPRLTIDGREIEAKAGQTVMEAALAAGIFIPYFCWHPQLSVPGNCRICVVGVAGKGRRRVGGDRLQHAGHRGHGGLHQLARRCARGARRRCSSSRSTTRSTAASATRRASARCRTTTTSTTASARSRSTPKVHATKHHDLSDRIVLDNERCIQCTRCVRFTREISKSNSLGMQERGDHSLVRAVRGRQLRHRPVLRQRDRHLPGGGAAVARPSCTSRASGTWSRRRRCARDASAAAA